MGQRFVVGVAAAAVLVAACGSSSVRVSGNATTTTPSPGGSAAYSLGPADSPYWIAGWLPKGMELWMARVTSVPDGTEVAYTPTKPADADPDIEVDALTYKDAPPLSRCDDKRLIIPTYRKATRGHPSCEGPDSDDGQQFGWIVSWIERPGLQLTVVNHDPDDVDAARPIARRIAESVRPVSAATWKKLVEMTTMALPPDAPRVVVARGDAGTEHWTLTAQLPPDYPLGADDRRLPCVELELGQTMMVCGESPGGGSRFARLAGHVFAFGIVPATTSNIELRATEPNSDKPTNKVVRSVVPTAPQSHVPYRFYAAALPADNCGVVVFDVTTKPAQQIAEAMSLPGDGPPCNQLPPGPPQTVVPGVRPTTPVSP